MAFKRTSSEDLFDSDRFWEIAEEVMTASKPSKGAENTDKKAKEEKVLLNAEDAFKKAQEAKLKQVINTVNEAVLSGAYSVNFNELLDWNICKVFEQKGYRIFKQPEMKKTLIVWGISSDY